MDNWYLLLQLQKQHHQALLREAEVHRLVHAETGSRQARLRFYQRWLSLAGAFLVLWGCRLQSRYAPLTLSGINGELYERRPESCNS